MPELDDSLYARVRGLCERGDDLVDDGRLDEALQTFLSAWRLLPEPRTDWEAATWILAATGDVNFQRGGIRGGL